MQLARKTNLDKTKWVISKIDFFIKNNLKKKDMKIGIFGITYKPNVNDLRESPALEIANNLSNKYDVILCEPNFREYKNFKIDTPNNTVLKSDILVFLVGHKEFKNIKTSNKKVFDFCGILADE